MRRLLAAFVILAVLLCLPFLFWGDEFTRWFTGDEPDAQAALLSASLSPRAESTAVGITLGRRIRKRALCQQRWRKRAAVDARDALGQTHHGLV